MKQLITLIFVILTLNASAQVIDTDKKIENKIVKKYKGKKFFNNLYKDIFKYATVYVAGDIGNAYETQYPDYFIRTNPVKSVYLAWLEGLAIGILIMFLIG